MTSPDLADIKQAVDRYLDQSLPCSSPLSSLLVTAMRYAVESGGKRLRPTLVCASGLGLGATLEETLAPAAAVELIHTYSLVHDDLPALDNDEVRRGKPSTHIAFGEANAVLVGDALQSLAFQVIADDLNLPINSRLEISRMLARAAGWEHMVGGQAFDISPDRDVDMALNDLERLHVAKTAALIRASIQMGAVTGGHLDPHGDIQQGLGRFGDLVGLGFQIVDDILDATRTTKELGKPAGSDAESERVTFVTLAGVEGARSRAAELLEESRVVLQSLQLDGSLLDQLAVNLIERAS